MQTTLWPMISLSSDRGPDNERIVEHQRVDDVRKEAVITRRIDNNGKRLWAVYDRYETITTTALDRLVTGFVFVNGLEFRTNVSAAYDEFHDRVGTAGKVIS